MTYLFFILIFNTLRLWAHPLDLGLVRVELTNPATLQLDLNRSLTARILALNELTEEELKSHSNELYQLTLANAKFVLGNQSCAITPSKVETVGQSVRVLTLVNCPQFISEGQFQLSLPFLHLKELPSTFEILAVIRTSDNEQIKTLKGGQDTLTVDIKASRGILEFIIMGLDHIGVTPSEWKNSVGFHLPEGIDHILFIIALILVGGGLSELVKTATGFTVGHSITLALASFNWVRLNSKWVESIIALSIAYVAIESILRSKPKHRWAVAGIFGLIHGFGFATVLGDLNLQGPALIHGLVGFNVGIEMGQLIIILICLPLLISLAKFPTVKLYFVKSVSAVIASTALFWFYQRAFA